MKRALSEDSEDEAAAIQEAREQRQAARQKSRQNQSDEEVEEEEISRSEDEKVEAFNLAEEREEGEFDEGGFFVFSKEKNEEPDSWADSLGKSKNIFSAEKIKKIEENAAAAAEFWTSEDKVPFSRLSAEREIVDVLLPGETPRKAMNRLTGRIPGAKKKFPGPKMTPEASAKFSKLTDACDAIAAQGFAEIYDTPREDLVFPGLTLSLQKMSLPMLMSQIPFYADRNSLQAAAVAILQQAPSLVPQVTSFSAGHNQTIVLFHINGALPVSVRGYPEYSVPIAIFFDPPFPRVPPRIFVTSHPGSSDLEIVPGHPFVAASGLVTLPSAWDPRRPGDLPGILVSAMSSNCPIPPPLTVLEKVLEESMAAAMDSVQGRAALAESRKTKLAERNNQLKEHEDRLITRSAEIAKRIEFLSGLRPEEAAKVDPMQTLKFRGKFLGNQAVSKITEIAALEDYAVVLEEAFRGGDISLADFLSEFRANAVRIFESRAICTRAISALHLSA